VIELLGVAGVAACLMAACTMAARVWGHGIGGVVSAFPVIVGPALLLSALRQDAAFVAAMATATLLGLVALSGFVLAYARSARRCGWPLSLGLAWAAAAVLGVLAGWVGGGLLGGLLAAVVSPTLAYAALPRGPKVEVRACFPRWEMPARMALTALLIVGLTVAADRLGPTVAGVLAALPTLASVLAVFTHARHGHDALVAMLRGMLGGLATFVSFCALIALLVEHAGVIPAFVLATGAALLVQLVVAVFMRRSRDDGRLLARSDALGLPTSPVSGEYGPGLVARHDLMRPAPRGRVRSGAVAKRSCHAPGTLSDT
jgi:fluoride ion exporter CrcB/FEX